MGRGRQKAKATKVARKLKYFSPETDYKALERELVSASSGSESDDEIDYEELAANVARVLPDGLIADVDRSSWTVPPVFSTVRELGSVPWEDLEGTLNLGVGMVAVVEPGVVDAVLRVAEGSNIPAWVLGEVHEAGKYEARGRVVAGTKRVDGGAVDIHGTYTA